MARPSHYMATSTDMTLMSSVQVWRSTLRERHLWLLLALFFCAAFVMESRSGVVNALRLLVFAPVLFVTRREDLQALWHNRAARWLLLLMAWLSVTLLWNGVSGEDWRLLQRGFYVVTLLLLVFLVSRLQPQRDRVVFFVYIFAGLAGAILIAMAWPGTPVMLGEQFPALDRSVFYTRGIFTISIYVAWIMAVLFIAAFFVALSTKGFTAVVFYLAATAFALLMVMAQSRAAWLAMAVGFAMAVALVQPRRFLWWLAGLVLVFATALILSDAVYELLLDNLQRGNSYRIAIWCNAIEQFLLSPLRILTGFGLSASTTNVAQGMVQNHYHSIYLSTFYYGGVIALGLYLGCLWQVFRQILASQGGKLWLCLLVPMQLIFVVDGEHFFVPPSAMMMAYLLPLFWAISDSDPLRSIPPRYTDPQATA